MTNDTRKGPGSKTGSGIDDAEKRAYVAPAILSVEDLEVGAAACDGAIQPDPQTGAGKIGACTLYGS